jgi:phosphoserine phosphatase
VVAPPFAAVFFDCDSTLSAIEGIDELVAGATPAVRAEVLALTHQAMAGTLPLADVYERRLRLLAPHRSQLAPIGELYVARLVPNAREVVRALRHLGKHVGILSGGLEAPVRHVAAHLGIDPTLVHAVAMQFDANGAYVDYDRSSPLARNGGKVEVVRTLPAYCHPLAFVGDGITDAETRGHVARFVGFGGVVVRPPVRERADVYVADPDLAAVLPHVLTAAERDTLARSAAFAPLLSPRWR